MIYELSNPVTKSLITHLRNQKSINTWKDEQSFGAIDEKNIIVATVLRAGMPMLDSAIELLSDATAGFLAMKRDEITHKSVLYYDRLPDCKGKTVLLVDPMVATGGSMCDAIELVKSRNPNKIITLNIIGSPEDLAVVSSAHPDVDIYIAQIDEKLNSDKFIIPGLGDAGDRSYNTVE